MGSCATRVWTTAKAGAWRFFTDVFILVGPDHLFVLLLQPLLFKPGFSPHQAAGKVSLTSANMSPVAQSAAR